MHFVIRKALAQSWTLKGFTVLLPPLFSAPQFWPYGGKIRIQKHKGKNNKMKVTKSKISPVRNC